MRGPIHQTTHIFYEVGYFLISLVSRVYNAINGGSMHQTYSSRVHIEAREARECAVLGLLNCEGAIWIKREKQINRLFPWQADHCARSWASEVSRARKTLARNGEYPVAGV